jgi:D-glycero-D-manno-heptose 1,7-bisphosphate phosphatase
VINRKLQEGRYVREWKDFELLPGVETAIAKMNARGIRVIVVSNQRGIALGLYTNEDVEMLHARLQRHLAAYGAHIDAFYYCPHDNAQCDCRKPATGLLDRAVLDFPDIRAQASVLIGDSLSDMEAAERFGCRSILVAGDPATRKPNYERAERLAHAKVTSLVDAVETILRD